MTDWISIEERSPTENGQYVVFLREGKKGHLGNNEEHFTLIRWRRSTAPRNKDRMVGHWGNCDRDRYKRITHWMHLSKPTEEK